VALRGVHDQPVDVALPDARAPRRLADVDDLRARRRLVEQLLRDETVVDHGLGLAQAAQRLERDQLRIAGAGTDERDARADHASSFEP
jgi:hypothetical protein